jgi:hypothetical protein
MKVASNVGVGSSAPMFAALSRTFFVIGITVLATACSGADTQDVLVGQASSSGTTITGTSGSPGSSGTGTSGNPGGTSGNPGGTSGDLGGGSCPPETEPNDTPAQANVLNPQLCGSVSHADQKDYLTFTIKGGTKTLSLNFKGGVRLRVTIDTKIIELTPDNAGVVPFVLGKPYLVEVTALIDSATPTPWQVTVIEK